MLKEYIGVKLIKAMPMTRGEYNNYRGWTIPKDENPDDDGYIKIITRVGLLKVFLKKHIKSWRE